MPPSDCDIYVYIYMYSRQLSYLVTVGLPCPVFSLINCSNWWRAKCASQATNSDNLTSYKH